MSIAVPNRMYDGNASFEGGMDSSRFPNLIPINCYAAAVNTVCRNSSLGTRPGWEEISLVVDSVANTDLELFSGYGFQGGYVYTNKTTGKSHIICAVRGRVYKIDLDTKILSQIYPAGVSASHNRDRSAKNYFCQAGKYLVIQDGKDDPLVYDGETIALVSGSKKIPKGTAMAYGQGRLFVLINEYEIKAGDLMFGGRTLRLPIATSKRGGSSVPNGIKSGLMVYVDVTGFELPSDISSVGAPLIIEGHSFAGLGTDNAINGNYDSPYVLQNLEENPEQGSTDYNMGSNIKKIFLPKVDYEGLVKASDPAYYLGGQNQTERLNAATVQGSGGFVTFILPGKESDVLSFQEDAYLSTGGVISTPTQMGAIRHLAFPTIADTATGQGDLFAFCDNGVSSFAVSLPRKDWKKSGIFQRVSLADIGCLGGRTVVNVNGDIYFRSHDGIRSYRNASATQAMPGQTSSSAEIQSLLSADAINLAGDASAIYFDSRYLLNIWGQRNDKGTQNVFSGVAALDFSAVQRNNKANVTYPAFDGVWTGLNFYQMIRGVFDQRERAFGFVDTYGTLGLYELNPLKKLDSAAFNVNTRIKSIVETRSFEFEKPYVLKKLSRCDIWVSNVRGEVNFKVSFRPDKYPCWIEWASFTRIAQMEYCPTTPEQFVFERLPASLPQFRPQIRLITPPDTVDTSTNRLFRMGYEFQLRIEWTGSVAIDKILLHADDVIEPIGGSAGEPI